MKEKKKTQNYFHCDAGFIVDSVKIASDTQEREYALCFATVACCRTNPMYIFGNLMQ